MQAACMHYRSTWARLAARGSAATALAAQSRALRLGAGFLLSSPTQTQCLRKECGVSDKLKVAVAAGYLLSACCSS